MIFLRHPSPNAYSPSSSHLHPYSFGFGRPHSKVYFWHPSGEHNSTTTEQHVDKKSKNDETNNQQLATTKKPQESGPTVLYEDRCAQVVDQDEALIMSLDLPGVKTTDVNVEVEDGVLAIHAERKSGSGKASKVMQQFYINDQTTDTSKLQANLSDGVLTITIPKKEEAKPRVIPVGNEHPPEESDDEKVLQFTYDLPGVKASNVKLEFQNRSISLHAERQRGRFTSNIDKEFYVDPSKVDTEAFKAYLMDGVLTITGVRKDIPKQKIAVSTGGLPAESNEKKVEAGKEEDGVLVETVKEDDKEEMEE